MNRNTYGIIYKITNNKNGKIYIGQKIHPYLKFKGYWGSGILIKRAIKKYGKECFSKEILYECNNQKELDEAETDNIKKFNATNKEIGYNILEYGGKTTKGYSTLKSWIRKYGKEEGLKKWRKQCKEYSKKMRGLLIGEKNGMFGKTHSDEVKELLSTYHSPFKGKKHTKKTKEKISKAKKGKKASEKTRKKMSEAQKRRDPKTIRRDFITSEEVKEKMRKTHKKNGTNKGKKNPMHGKTVFQVWVEKFGEEEALERKASMKEKRLRTLKKKKMEKK